MEESTLNAALRKFEAVEANLVKTEKVLNEVMAAIPSGIAFGENPEHERNSREFYELFGALPAIDGWKPDIYLMELNEIAQSRLDANEIGEFELLVSVQERIDEPARLLRDYRYRFDKKRRELVRDAITELIDTIDEDIRQLSPLLEQDWDVGKRVESAVLEELAEHLAQVGALLGSSTPLPPRWSGLHRHLRFGEHCDLRDIIQLDWPAVRDGLRSSLYGEKEPVPVEADDLGDLVKEKPSGPVATRLHWDKLDEESFERLVFTLISSEAGYENPQWLTRTNAADRGRDLSVERVYVDSLAGTTRQRVIIQCKHWLTRGVSPADIALLKEQMKLWEPPRVDVCVIVTSGRFTSDAVDAVETHNQSDSALKLEMWPESHMELLVASRPWIIAEYGLR